jgi:hypothetical protein
MSMEHRAFAFDWAAFAEELLPTLVTGLPRCQVLLLVNLPIG